MWSRGRGGKNQRGNMKSRGRPPPFRGRGSSRSRGGFINKAQRPFNKTFTQKRPFDLPKEKRYNGEVLSEVDTGITEYISSLEGFNGILKSRYSDFQVNEIDTDGNVAKLTDLSVPVDPEPGKIIYTYLNFISMKIMIFFRTC